LDVAYKSIIIGAGNIGQAIANYGNFAKLGYTTEAIFDINPKLIGLKIRDIEIFDIDTLESYLSKNKIDVGIICTPREQAQKVTNTMINAGIKAIWNFAPVDLVTPGNVIVENVHLSDSLLTLTYRMNEPKLFKDIHK
jgi:redox-sensing transcriptional repressor